MRKSCRRVDCMRLGGTNIDPPGTGDVAGAVFGGAPVPDARRIPKRDRTWVSVLPQATGTPSFQITAGEFASGVKVPRAAFARSVWSLSVMVKTLGRGAAATLAQTLDATSSYQPLLTRRKAARTLTAARLSSGTPWRESSACGPFIQPGWPTTWHVRRTA